VGDWLGTGTIAPFNRVYLPCEDAKKVIHKLGLKSQSDFLGTSTIAPQNRVFLTCKDAKKFIHPLGLKSRKEWNEYCKSGDKPDDIPSAPWKTYKNKGWINLKDWLGY